MKIKPWTIKKVKVQPSLPYKMKVLEDVREVAVEMDLIKEGKLKARYTEDLFDEL